MRAAEVDEDGLVRTAHADAWALQGALRAPSGGGAVELPGIRLMASGIAHPQWNSGDVHDPSAVDIAQVTRWYGTRGLPWGVSVPAGAAWSHGRFLFRKRLMGLPAPDLREPAGVPGLTVRRAGLADLAAVLAVDVEAFGADPALERRWLEPHLTADAATVVLGELDGEPVATAYSLRSDGWTGPALYVGGVAVVRGARRRGIGAAVSGWLVTRGLAEGAQLAHLHPDTEQAARIYGRLGFREVAGLDVYLAP